MDADGLIKLGKAGVLRLFFGVAEVLVPEAVYEEAVVRGKRELYEDAFALEMVLREAEARVAPDVSDPWAEKLLEEGGASLGMGERSALHLYGTEGADAILTDDRVFLSFLGRAGAPALTPTAVIVRLVEAGRMEVEEGLKAMSRIRECIREPVHQAAVEEIEAFEGVMKDDGGRPRKGSEER